MPGYDELKSELHAISKIVELYPEAVKPQVFDLLIRTFLGHSPQPTTFSSSDNPPIPPASHAKRKSIRRRGPVKDSSDADSTTEKLTPKRGSSKESYKIDRDLNLRGDKSIPSFKTFVNEKKPGSAKEFNAVAVYYLQKLAGLTQITLNHAYTCYSEVSRRPPEAFRQSFIDTKNKEGWVEFSPEGNLRIPHRGSVFVEHDLPKEEKRKVTK